jgi:acetoin utilization protein AcuB
MLASELMTPAPTTVEVTASVQEALAILTELDVRHLPVVDGDELVGILSDRDLREFLGPVIGEHEALSKNLDAQISSLMASHVHTVGPEDDICQVIDLMLEHKLGGVPVVTDDTGALVGMVSYVDIIREARSLL